MQQVFFFSVNFADGVFAEFVAVLASIVVAVVDDDELLLSLIFEKVVADSVWFAVIGFEDCLFVILEIVNAVGEVDDDVLVDFAVFLVLVFEEGVVGLADFFKLDCDDELLLGVETLESLLFRLSPVVERGGVTEGICVLLIVILVFGLVVILLLLVFAGLGFKVGKFFTLDSIISFKCKPAATDATGTVIVLVVLTLGEVVFLLSELVFFFLKVAVFFVDTFLFVVDVKTCDDVEFVTSEELLLTLVMVFADEDVASRIEL